MQNNFLIISAATENSDYVECLKMQRDYFDSIFFNYYGMIVKDRGSWEENTKIKPEAIRKGFEINKIVLWIDADCLIKPLDVLPRGNWDIATIRNIHPRHKCKISAGFIMFKDTPETRKFLDIWEEFNNKAKKDHPALINALKAARPWLKVSDMSRLLRGRHTINALKKERGVFSG